MTADGGSKALRNPQVEVPPEVEAAIRRDCTAAAREMAGPGYTPDYYQQIGAEFEWVALGAYCQGVRAGRDAEVAR